MNKDQSRNRWPRKQKSNRENQLNQNVVLWDGQQKWQTFSQPDQEKKRHKLPMLGMKKVTSHCANPSTLFFFLRVVLAIF